jgi:hypothetical protein
MRKFSQAFVCAQFFMISLLWAAVSTPSYALYDPAPVASIAALEGTWRGTLQYRDYQPPFGKVSLPTQLYAALLSPNELALHYVYDDGPGKIIHSYDRLKIDLPVKVVTFTAAKAGDIIVANVVSSATVKGALEIIAEVETMKQKIKFTMRYTLRLSATEIEILKEESDAAAAGKFEFRSKYGFTRAAN